MSSAAPKISTPLERLRSLAAARLPETSALRTVKTAALERFLEQGYPTQRDEDWKYTNLKRLESRSFELAAAAPISARTVERQAIAAPGWLRLVFVNGHFNAALSSARPASIRILGALARTSPDQAAELLQSESSANSAALTALNTAFTDDGLSLEIADDTTLAEPIYCLFLWTAIAAPAMTHPRIVVRLGSNARAQLIEHFVGTEISRDETSEVVEPVIGQTRESATLIVSPSTADGMHSRLRDRPAASAAGFGTSDQEASGQPVNVHAAAAQRAESFTNTVTQIRLGAGARLDHYRLQEEGSRSFHLGATFADLQRDANFVSHSFAFGAALSRVSTDVYLQEAGAQAALRGLFFTAGTSHSDVHTRVEHLAPRTQSLQNFRGIAAGRGRGVFNGKVRVAPHAQKISAEQSSRNLLLGPLCEIDTKPELEIYADDVKCSHGATTGQLDTAALFYLRSRGIEEREARSMLTEAFAASVLASIDLAPLREHLDKHLRLRLGRTENEK